MENILKNHLILKNLLIGWFSDEDNNKVSDQDIIENYYSTYEEEPTRINELLAEIEFFIKPENINYEEIELAANRIFKDNEACRDWLVYIYDTIIALNDK